MAKNVITIQVFISVDIANCHDKCQIIISFKSKVWFLFLSESRRNQMVNYVSNLLITVNLLFFCGVM